MQQMQMLISAGHSSPVSSRICLLLLTLRVEDSLRVSSLLLGFHVEKRLGFKH